MTKINLNKNISNLEITSPSNGQAIVYDSVAGVWKNATISGSGTGSGDMLKSVYDTDNDGIVDTVIWDNITDLPTTFSPSTHTHYEDEIVDLDHDAMKLQGRSISSEVPASGEVLRYNGTSWEPYAITASGVFLPGCRVYRNSVQEVGAGASAFVSFSHERWDTDNMWSSGSPTRITFNTPGYYIVTGNMEVEVVSDTTRRLISIVLNTDTTIAVSQLSNTSGVPARLNVTTVYHFDDGDYVEFRLLQSASVALDIIYSPNTSPEFTAQMIYPD